LRYIGSWSGRQTADSGRKLNPKEIIVASYGENSGDQTPPVNQTGTSSGAAAPAKSGGCLKIVLIVVAILVVLGLLALASVGYVAWRVKKAIHLEGGPNGQVSMNLPGMSYSASTEPSFTASDLGTDIYPGAQSVKGGMRMELPTGSMVTGVFVTSDSKDQVVTYYKAKFGSGASTMDTEDGAILTLTMGDKESVMVTVTGKPSENEGKTKIVILHTKNNKAS
jgi:hypothetical protein